MPLLDLLAAYWDYKDAVRAMLAADHLEWPCDPLRDAVQAQGMRFCEQWRTNADTIAQIVADDPVRYAFYHTPSTKGALADPRAYAEHHRIMTILLE